MSQNEERAPLRKTTWVFSGLGCLVGLAVFGLIGMALTRGSPAREVTFVGGWPEIDPSCHGPDVLVGTDVWTACDWAYDRRALVRVDLTKAEAHVVHRWEIDDGNVPRIVVHQRCGEGQLFVVRETKQTTAIRVDGTDASAFVAPHRGEDVLGAACVGEAVEVAFRTPSSKSGAQAHIQRLDGSQERQPFRPVTALQGLEHQPIGGWHEDGAWNFFAADVLSGHLLRVAENEDPVTLMAVEGAHARRFVGPPVGRVGSVGDTFFRTGDSGWALRRASKRMDRNVALFVESETPLGFRMEDDQGWHFSGLGEEEYSIRLIDGRIVTQVGQRPARTVARASAFAIAPRAFALSHGHVAFLGRLGTEVIVVDGAMKRVNPLTVTEKLARPWSSFRASAKSTFDLICFYTLPPLTLLFFLSFVLCLARRQSWPERRLILSTAFYLLVALICGRGFWTVVSWL